MNDCDRVRAHLKVKVECCAQCHERGDLTSYTLRTLGPARVCCTLAGLILPRDRESQAALAGGVDQL